jgi:hypothetical protein
MRTTVAVDDHLLAAAKQRARERGVTLGVLVEEALRHELSAEPRAGDAAAVPVHRGEGGLRPGVDLSSNRAIAELLDEGQPLDRRR